MLKFKYTKFYQNVPCGSSVISFSLTVSLTVDGRTHTGIIVQTCGLCNISPFLDGDFPRQLI